jgi:hypothetical protein
VKFEWDPNKAAVNLRRHHVSFDEAIEVFYDSQAVEGIDWDHSTADEQRFFVIGLSTRRLLYVVYGERRRLEGNEIVVRIIHARQAEKEHRDMNKPTNKSEEYALDVTPEMVERDKAAGIEEEFILKPGRHILTRLHRSIQPDELVVVNGKVRVVLYVDADVIEFFTAGGADYRTEINAALRAVVERAKFEQALLSDEVVEKLAGKLAQSLESHPPADRPR